MSTTNLVTMLHYLSRNARMKAVMYMLLVSIIVLIVQTFIWANAKFINLELHNAVVVQRNHLYTQSQLQKLNEHLQQTLPIIEAIERKYKSSPGQSDVMKQLGGLIREHHLRLHSQSISAMGNESENSSINSIELMLSGRYVDIRALLGKLPTMNAWIEVSDIRIERANQSHVGAQVRLLLIKESGQ